MTWKLKLLLVLGLLCILDTIIVLFLGNSINLGIILPAILGLIIIYYCGIKLNIINPPSLLTNRVIIKLLVVVCSILLISFLMVEFLIFYTIEDDSAQSCQYLIVLGGGIREQKASLVLRERLERSVKYIKNHQQLKKIIVTGGQGPWNKLPEAEVMKDYLVKHDIAVDKIIVEDQAGSTMENLKFSKRILNSLDISPDAKIAVITSEFHLWRTEFLAERNGLELETIPASTPWYIIPNLALREYFAVVKSYVWDR